MRTIHILLSSIALLCCLRLESLGQAPNYSPPSTTWPRLVPRLSRHLIGQSRCTAGNCGFTHNSGVFFRQRHDICLAYDFHFLYTLFDITQWGADMRRLIRALQTLTQFIKSKFTVQYGRKKRQTTVLSTPNPKAAGLFSLFSNTTASPIFYVTFPAHWDSQPTTPQIFKRSVDTTITPSTTTTTTRTTSATTTVRATPVTPGLSVTDTDLAYVGTLQNLFDDFDFMLNHRMNEVTLPFHQLWSHATEDFTPFPFPQFSLRGEDLEKNDNFIDINPLMHKDHLKNQINLAEVLLSKQRIITSPTDPTTRIRFNDRNDSDMKHEFEFLLQMQSQVNNIFETADDILHDLLNHQLPYNLFNPTQLENYITQTIQLDKSILTTAEMRLLLQSIPFTFAYSRSCKTSTRLASTECPLNLGTVIPSIPASRRYNAYDVETVPTLHKGVFTNDWRLLEVPEQHIIMHETDFIPLKTEDLICHQTNPENACDICLLTKAIRTEPSECLTAILNSQNPWKVCTYKDLEKVEDQISFLRPNEFAYVDPIPGTIATRCPGNETEKESLLPSGLLTLKPECQYTITNGPFPIAIAPNNIDLIFNTNLHEFDTSRMDTESILSDHWDKNGIYYFISLLALFGVSAISTAIYLCCRQRMTRPYFRRRQALADMELKPTENLTPMASLLQRALNRSEIV